MFAIRARMLASGLMAGLFTNVLGKMEFINPPPFGEKGDFSNSESYRQGQTVNVVWTPGESGGAVSLCLYQQNETTGVWFGDMEYLTQNAVDITRYTWLVGTRKNLIESNLFYLSIFQEGKGPADSNSHYFYIEEKQVEGSAMSSFVSSPSTSSMSPSRSTSGSMTSSKNLSSAPMHEPTGKSTNTAPTSEATRESTNTADPSMPANSSSGFPTSAKIGVGVGIPVALIIGLVAGFLLFRRRKKRDMSAGPPYMLENNGLSGPQAKYYQDIHEAPPKWPVEMGDGDTKGYDGWRGELAAKPPAPEPAPPPTPASVRPEV